MFLSKLFPSITHTNSKHTILAIIKDIRTEIYALNLPVLKLETDDPYCYRERQGNFTAGEI